MRLARKHFVLPESVIRVVQQRRSRPIDPDQATGWQQDLVDWVLEQRRPTLQTRAKRPPAWRFFPLWLGVVLTFVILESRALELMLIKGKAYGLRAQENRVLIRRVIAPRGIIFDRRRQTLSQNRPAFRLNDGERPRYLDRQTAWALQATGAGEIVIDSIRTYPLAEKMAHLIGYTAEINQEELYRAKGTDYRAGDLIGRAGIEETYENKLRGRNGRELVEVNAHGEELRQLAQEEPVSGGNLVLTVDAKLQESAVQALQKGMSETKSPAGAVVITDPQNGGILSLVSLPSFNPNLFIQGDAAELAAILSDPGQPLLNRAVSGVFPPGSSLKPAVAAGALAAGVIKPETMIEDTGVINLGPYAFANWYFTQYGRVEGALDLVGAIRRSNDIYFYRVGERLGHDLLAQWLNQFGFGRRLGIDLPGEAAGLIGGDQWKRDSIGEPWYPGDTLHLAIGQGFVQVTPLQLNLMTAVFANGGVLWQPKLVQAIEAVDGTVTQLRPEALSGEVVPTEHLDVVREGMRQACLRGGTGWPLFDFSVSLGCKTGTAELGNEEEDTHAWFTVFAPFEKPEIVITVLLEKGGEGSTNAAPVAKEILEWWFSSR